LLDRTNVKFELTGLLTLCLLGSTLRCLMCRRKTLSICSILERTLLCDSLQSALPIIGPESQPPATQPTIATPSVSAGPTLAYDAHNRVCDARTDDNRLEAKYKLTWLAFEIGKISTTQSHSCDGSWDSADGPKCAPAFSELEVGVPRHGRRSRGSRRGRT